MFGNLRVFLQIQQTPPRTVADVWRATLAICSGLDPRIPAVSGGDSGIERHRTGGGPVFTAVAAV